MRIRRQISYNSVTKKIVIKNRASFVFWRNRATGKETQRKNVTRKVVLLLITMVGKQKKQNLLLQSHQQLSILGPV